MEKHGLRFEDAAPIFMQSSAYNYVSEHPGNDDVRYVRVGELNGKCFAVVYTLRGDTIRIISFRRARDGEERKYRALQFG